MKREAVAVWAGNLVDGAGSIDTQSGALKKLAYSFEGRFLDEQGRSGTNPEELIAAAHAGCFAMQLSHLLAEYGKPAKRIEATAQVSVEPDAGGGFSIRSSALTLVAEVPGIQVEEFNKLADQAKA